MRVYVYAVIVLALIAALGGIYAAGYSSGSTSKQAEWDKAAAAQRRAEAEQSNRAAIDLEGVRAKERVIVRTITQSVDRIVDRPVYRNLCLDDDGLRLARCAIRGESPDTCKPDEPVRGAPEPERRDGRSRVALDYGRFGVLSGLRE